MQDESPPSPQASPPTAPPPAPTFDELFGEPEPSTAPQPPEPPPAKPKKPAAQPLAQSAAKTKRPWKPRRRVTFVIKDKLIEALRANGGNIAAACGIVGISRKAFNNALKLPHNQDLLDAVEIFNGAILHKMIVHLVKNPAKKSGNSHFLLERAYYRQFGKRDPLAVTPEQLASVVSKLGVGIGSVVPPEFHSAMQAKIEEILATLPQANDGGDGGNEGGVAERPAITVEARPATDSPATAPSPPPDAAK